MKKGIEFENLNLFNYFVKNYNILINKKLSSIKLNKNNIKQNKFLVYNTNK